MNKYFEFELYVMVDGRGPAERVTKVGEIIGETEETVTVVYLSPFNLDKVTQVFRKQSGIEFNYFQPELKSR